MLQLPLASCRHLPLLTVSPSCHGHHLLLCFQLLYTKVNFNTLAWIVLYILVVVVSVAYCAVDAQLCHGALAAAAAWLITMVPSSAHATAYMGPNSAM
jgi:hypothetical protein